MARYGVWFYGIHVSRPTLFMQLQNPVFADHDVQCRAGLIFFLSIPTTAGRLCMLTESDESISIRERCRSLQMYSNSLYTTCRAGSAGTLQWTPNADTPDTVYYQVGRDF